MTLNKIPRTSSCVALVSVAQVAKHFDVDCVTVRRWLRSGCPCVRRGQRGPGRGSLLDLQHVAQWRGKARQGGVTVEETMQKIAVALRATLVADHADIRAGIDRASAAAVLIMAFECACQTFGAAFPFDQLPTPIRTLMHEL